MTYASCDFGGFETNDMRSQGIGHLHIGRHAAPSAARPSYGNGWSAH
jgi:hypothetical protein